MKYTLAIIIIAQSIFASALFAQKREVVYYPVPVEKDRAGDYVYDHVTIWDGTKLRREPRGSSETIEVLNFGDDLALTGKKAYVIDEELDYLEVLKRNGTMGWIKETLLANGDVMVITENTYYKKSPGGAAPYEKDFFEAGELVVVKNFNDDNNWLQVVARNSGKNGWIEGFEKVSVRNTDIAIALEIYTIFRTTPDGEARRRQLHAIKNDPKYQNSGMETAVMNAINKTFYGEGTASSNNNSGNYGGGRFSGNSSSEYFNDGENLDMQEVVDLESGRSYMRITETGTIQPVVGPINPRSDYWCYHKTRPIGSFIHFYLPEGGYLKLEVVDRLRQDSSHVIGLGDEVLLQIFGTVAGLKNQQAKFSYPQ